MKNEGSTGKAGQRGQVTMSKLFQGVKGRLYQLQGVSVDEVIVAEKKLGLRFSEDYRNYLLEYGCVSFGRHELLGLGGDAYLDVVKETLRERQESGQFPKDCYLIENLGIDGIRVLQDAQGNIYEQNDAGVKKIYNDFSAYIDSIGS